MRKTVIIAAVVSLVMVAAVGLLVALRQKEDPRIAQIDLVYPAAHLSTEGPVNLAEPPPIVDP